jgi:adenosylcobinamide-GDP ribazoletransferase
MLPWFPAAGLFIGALLCLFDFFASWIWGGAAVAVLDVVFLAILTGGLHLDGLGDAADGLYGKRTREKALSIMKDSRIGAMGVIAIFAVLSIKGAALSDLSEMRYAALFLVPAYARSGLLFGIRLLPYGRPEGGTGTPFFGRTLSAADLLPILIPVALSFVLFGSRAILFNVLFAAITAAILFFYKKRIGCITGDMLGAMCEILEAFLFLILAAGGNI